MENLKFNSDLLEKKKAALNMVENAIGYQPLSVKIRVAENAVRQAYHINAPGVWVRGMQPTRLTYPIIR